MSPGERPLLVLGAGGLLGRAVLAQRRDARRPPPVNWQDPAVAAAVLGPWFATCGPEPVDVLWAAGGGFVGVTEESMALESALLDAVLVALGRSGARVASFGLAGSAGGVYAGLAGRVDERSPLAPVSAYGRGKQQQEEQVLAWGQRTGVPVALARYANLYGPGQRLDKAQGLVTSLARAAVTRRPMNIFVPLDTRRDYVFVRDAATTTLRMLAAAAAEETALTKIVASGRTTTIAELLGLVERMMRRPCPLTFAATPAGQQQPASLSFRSVVSPDLDAVPRTTLSEGVAAVVHDVVRRLCTDGRPAVA